MDATSTPQSEKLDEFESAFVDHCMNRYGLSRDHALLVLAFHMEEGMEEAAAVQAAKDHSSDTTI